MLFLKCLRASVPPLFAMLQLGEEKPCVFFVYLHFVLNISCVRPFKVFVFTPEIAL